MDHHIIINSALYKEFFEEQDEIFRHKWVESEKKGYDIGLDRAVIEWVMKHRSEWRKSRKGVNARSH